MFPPYARHPLAKLLPGIDPKQFLELVADIRRHGLREPIVLFEGKVLDGYLRLEACAKAGVEPRFEDFDGDFEAAAALMVSKNLHRRQLRPSQRAMIAHKIATMVKGARTDLPHTCGRSQTEAARWAGVSPRYVSGAGVMTRANNPAIDQMVVDCSMTIRSAEKLVRSSAFKELSKVKTIEDARRLQARNSSEFRRSIEVQTSLLTWDLLERQLRAMQFPSERALKASLAAATPDGRRSIEKVLSEINAKSARCLNVCRRFDGGGKAGVRVVK